MSEFSYTNRFSLYGDAMLRGITLEELVALQTETGGALLARSEDSGSEGRYCEVARWNERTSRWERFAFYKYLDDPLDDANAAANVINRAAWHYGDRPLVHIMPDWKEVGPTANPQGA